MSLEAFAENGRFVPNRIATTCAPRWTRSPARSALAAMPSCAGPDRQPQDPEASARNSRNSNRVEPRFGSQRDGLCLVSLGTAGRVVGLTALQLVREGHPLAM